MAVTTNTKSSSDELAYFAAASEAKAAITQPCYFETVAKAFPLSVWIALTEHDSGMRTERAQFVGERFSSLPSDIDAAPKIAADCAAPFAIQFTTGTTARPKGVVWTHANALWGT